MWDQRCTIDGDENISDSESLSGYSPTPERPENEIQDVDSTNFFHLVYATQMWLLSSGKNPMGGILRRESRHMPIEA